MTASDQQLLSPRFQQGRSPAHQLTPIQQQQVAQIWEKLRQGRYQFEATNCAVCSGQGFRTLAEIDRYGLKHPVCVCKDCGLIQTNPRLTADSYAEFYNDEYQLLHKGEKKTSDWLFEAEYDRAPKAYEYLSSVTDLGESLSVLDIGAGAGGTMAYFRDQGHSVVGYDLGEQNATYAQTTHELDLRVGSAEDASLSDAPDVITLSHVVEHFLDPVRELRAIRELCHEETVVYIEVPGIRMSMRPMFADFQEPLQTAHTFYFTLTTLSNVCRKAGFEREAGSEYVRSIWTPGEITVDFDSEYPVIMDVLDRREFYGPIPTPYLLSQYATSPQFVNFVRSSGFYPTAKRLYNMAFS
ncbi:Methyltransferase domain-containing protein [Halopelagius inordinatus]|uniref:Methyltransferase domain-containing protein n=1 Tax=Halopelagius inordinatus TaxID=553467 RepID=A0A1I2PMR9_9EURY|nr:class I SAM-dependent methyltransferase [Halopelagius inordinatus]SFG17442.1 Methyltransferase domain-containing protein [Halopelagius inordinatus]